MRWRCRWLPTGVVAALGLAVAPGRAAAQESPTLAVFIEVDQLRGDLLERYDPLFTAGFRRLLDQGFRFTQASHRHAATETAVGHATLATGVFPSRHGLIANSWSEQRGGRWVPMYSVGDDSVAVLGRPDSGGRSPRNLLRTGIADWIIRRDPESLVVSISGKDRAAIPLAGKVRGHVYWLDGAEFVTSTFYREALPPWVRAFNEAAMPALWADTVWNSRVPPAEAHRSRPDTAAYEGDGVHTSFPHRFGAEAKGEGRGALLAWMQGTPAPDAALGALAGVALRELDLGRRGHLDFLSVAFSQTDYVGHLYGPLSREQMDNLLRLDQVLGTLFDELDREVGAGRWVAALSADHGVLTEPEWRKSEGEPGARLGSADLARVLRYAAAPPEDPVAAIEGLEALGSIAAVYGRSELERGAVPDSFAVLYRNSLYPGRVRGPLARAGLEVRQTEGTAWSTAPTGTTHGSPYWYDRWVPLVFLGAGVLPGVSEATVYTVDAAPTLARLAGVPTPEDLDGKPILR